MNALLLAAGLGTRFRPHTNLIPKPAIPLLNVPLAYHPLVHFNNQQISALTANLHHLPEQIEALFLDARWKQGPLGEIPVQFSREDEQLLGSGGAIWNAQQTLQTTPSFWYINGDELILGLNEEDIDEMTRLHQASNALVTILTTPHPGAGREFGAICVDPKNQRVRNIKRKASSEENPLHFVGIMLVRREIYDFLPTGASNIFYDTIVDLLDSQLVNAYTKELEWIELGNPTDFLVANQRLLEVFNADLYSNWQSRFRCYSNDSGLVKEKQALIWKHQDSSQKESVRFRGAVTLGPSSIVSSDVTNSVIGPGVHVKQPVSDELVLV